MSAEKMFLPERRVYPANLKVLIFDTETTGLPKKLPSEHPDQPWVIQLGAVILDLNSDRFEHTINTLVKPPDTAEIDLEKFAAAEKVHGFSIDTIMSQGREMNSVMRELRDMCREVDMVASYNFDFDEKIIRYSSIRTHPTFIYNPVLATPDTVQRHCIMHQAKAYYNADKFLKLSAVYENIKGAKLEAAHDALADAVAAAEVFKELTWRIMTER